MRIFQVCGDPGIAPDGTKGAAVHLRAIAAALQALGHETVLLPARMPADPAGFGRPVRPLECAESVLAAAAESGTPECVYERYALGHVAGLEAARRLGVPFVLEVNAPLVEETRAHRPARLVGGAEAAEKRLFREADLVAAVSGPMAGIVERIRGDREGVVVVRNGCDPALFPEPATCEPVDEPVLAFLGHPKPWHGAESLPGLLPRLDAEGFRARILIVGGGEGADAVRARARELGADGRIEITGPVAQAEAALRIRDATLAVAPYPAHEVFYFCPLKVIECMAAGLPVVTTAQGDLPGIVGDGGVLVAPGDDAAFAGAVVDLLAAPRLRHAMGRRARRRALRDLTWEASATALAAAIAGLRPGAAP